MPLNFGPDCPYHVYLNGENNEIHLNDGSLLYTISLAKTPHRGTGVSTKLLKDAHGNVKYIITQERNKEDIYDPPVYFVSAVRPTLPDDKPGKVFKAGHGHVGRVFQEGWDICVSFRKRDSLKERASLSSGKESAAEGAREGGAVAASAGESAAAGANTEDSQLERTISKTSTLSEGEDVPPAEPEPAAEGTTGQGHEGPGSKVMRWFSNLLRPSPGSKPRYERFVLLRYDGRGRWIYQASQVPRPTPDTTITPTVSSPAAAAEEGLHTVPAPTRAHEPVKDIVLAHKEAEDEKKGFLGLRAVVMEEGNVWLRDLVIATWLAVLWEEERWSRLPAKLRLKGLEYLGGWSGEGWAED